MAKKRASKKAVDAARAEAKAPAECMGAIDAEAVLAEAGVPARPRTPGDLHEFVTREFGLSVPTRALVAGHSSPMDYLCHAFFEDRVPRDCVVWASRGGGKTFLAALATLLDLVFKPGIEVRVLAGSLEQGKRMHAHLRGLLARETYQGLIDGRITERRVALKNGSVVEVLAQSQTSVRGTRVQKLRCDEVELFDPEVWEAAQLVTREKQCGEVFVPGSVECLSTMHVPYGIMHRLVSGAGSEGQGGSIVHEDAQGRAVGAVRSVFRWGVVDVLGVCGIGHVCERRSTDGDVVARCPLLAECGGRAKERDAAGESAGHVSVDDAARLKKRVGEATWAAEMLCERPRRTDCVLPEFDAGVHVRACPRELEESLESARWVCGMDFGFRAPTVVLWAVVAEDGVVWVVDERVVSQVVLEEHIGSIVRGRWPVPAWVGVDPAGRQRSGQTGVSEVQALKAAGLQVRDRAMRVEEGLGLVRARLRPAEGEPRVYVHPRCVRLIESVEKYHYPSERPESAEPVKDGNDHAVDALRYLVQNLDKPYRTKTGRWA
jgi:hypothetical protein